MTATTDQARPRPTEAAPRTYGNWRRPVSPGLPRLGLLGTAAVLSSLVLVMLVQISAGLRAALVVAALSAGAVAPLAWRNRADRNGWQVLLAALLWRLGRRRRQHLYRSALVGPLAFGATRLPGLLASSRLLEATTAHGEPFALVHLPSTRHYAVLLRCDPEGSSLVDADTVDTWVAGWGSWLAALGHEASLEACSVTIETAPDVGARLNAEVATLLVADAPALSRAVLTEAADRYPHGAAAVNAYVTLTFTARTRTDSASKARSGQPSPVESHVRVRSEHDMAAEIGRRLPLLLHQLRGTGAGLVRAMTAAEVAATVRSAYDPTAPAFGDFAAASAGDCGFSPPAATYWDNAGPAATVEAWGDLRHDNAASTTWQMVEPPRGAVTSRVLEQLLQPHDELIRKRVTLLYRPYEPASAARVADADVRTSLGRATARPGESRAVETLALAAARQAAAEQAAGAGLVRFSLLVTATVHEPSHLPHAGQQVEQLAAACQLRLRRCYGSQAAAFTAALGVGVVLPSHIAVPELVRDQL
jgi:hypothetical protein